MSATTMPAIPMPRLPSREEIERDLRERLPGLNVYNPSEDWVEFTVFGLSIWAKPDLNGGVSAHPVTNDPVKCDGVTVLRGRYPMLHGKAQKDSSGKEIAGQDAPAMVKFIVDPANYGQMGVVWLPGRSADEDEGLKLRSRAVYFAYQRQRDEMIVGRRMEFKKNWGKGPHKGEPCPPPTVAEMAAIERIQERKSSTKIWKYECDVAECETGYATDDWDKFARHMRVSHRIAADRSRYDGEVEAGRVVRGSEMEAGEDVRLSIEAAAEALQKAQETGKVEPESIPAAETEEAEDTPRTKGKSTSRPRR